MDCFDRLPDSLILLIFTSVSDVKTLIQCGLVCKRFYLLVPQTESLLLRIDRVISSESDSESLLLNLFKSLLYFLLPRPGASRSPRRTHTSPAQILSHFHSIRRLHIELPSTDHGLGKGTVLRWRAEFGETLKNCVILGSPSATQNSADTGGDDPDFAVGLKRRVMWTISSLIAASVRHYLLKEVINEHEEMERIIVGDREGEGVVVMEREGLREWREHGGDLSGYEDRCRTVVPCVRMRMRHDARSDATLMVVWAAKDGSDMAEEGDLALKAFGGGTHEEAVTELLRSKSYLLEMNSF